jgi:hypothetical protein
MASNDADAPRDEERRRLLKCGLVAAPLLMTLAARPAAAGQAMGSLGAYDYGTNTNTDDPADEDAPDPWGQGAGSLRGPRR